MAAEDLKTFIREVTRRNEIVWNDVRADLHQGRLVLVGLQNEIAGMHGAIADVRADLKAHTQAVLSLIDEIKD